MVLPDTPDTIPLAEIQAETAAAVARLNDLIDFKDRRPYCEAKGCAGLPARSHLEAHTRDGSTGPEQVAELIDAFAAAVRTAALNEAWDALLLLVSSASSTGQRVGVSRAMDELRRLATNPTTTEATDA